MDKHTRVSVMDAEVALLFFIIVRWAISYGIKDSQELRNHIMDWLTANGFIKTAYNTKRTPEEVVRDLKKKGFIIDDHRRHD